MARDAIRRTQRELRETRKAEQRQRMEERLEEIRVEAEARRAERNTRRAEREARKAEQEQQKAETVKEIHALPESGTNEAKEIQELAADLERDARTAAMAADVPVIDFPEENEKYNTARKYGYV